MSDEADIGTDCEFPVGHLLTLYFDNFVDYFWGGSLGVMRQKAAILNDTLVK